MTDIPALIERLPDRDDIAHLVDQAQHCSDMESARIWQNRYDEVMAAVDQLFSALASQQERIAELERQVDEWREQAQRDSALVVCNEKQAATIAELRDERIKTRADAFTRLLLLDAYLDMGDLNSIRSAIEAWRVDLAKAGETK